MNRWASPAVIILMLAALPGGSNTTRDIGEPPKLDMTGTGRWILFYVNVERASRNLHPLTHDPVLEKAAVWQAGQCARIGDLTHSSLEAAMSSPGKRVTRFGGRWKVCGENMAMEFAMDMADRPFTLEKDAQGEYLDFHDYRVKWFDDMRLARSIVDAWMKHPGHRGHVLRENFFSTGVGVQGGYYSKHPAFFACQVFTGNAAYDFSRLSVRVEGGEGKKTYRISHAGKLPVQVIELRNGYRAVVHDVSREKNGCVFQKPAKEGVFFICLHDADKGIFYPVKPL